MKKNIYQLTNSSMRQNLQNFVMLCLLLFSTAGYAQQSVSGTVKDANNNTLIGVNVIIQGTTTGTTSDIDGRYSLSVPGSSSVLVFSFIGYTTSTEVVGNRSVVNVTLEEDVSQLDEVVISALGFEQKRDELGNAVSIVQTEDMVRSGESMLLNSLGAKASNVQVQRSNGDPGAGVTIRIRGANTISGSSDPLIILDGVPISNDTYYGAGNEGRDGGTSQQSRLNDINPNDIESMQILKGASAAALWGSRAANGVLVITTKSGAAGRMHISYKGTYSVDQVNTRIPMQNIFGQGRDGSYSPTRAESWGDYIPDRSGAPDEVQNAPGDQYFEADNGTRYYAIDTKNSRETFEGSNWDAAFQDGSFYQQDLSVSGGKKDATYFFSLGRLDQKGIIRNSDYDRTNLRLNNNFELSNWLTVSTKISYTRSSSNRIQQSSNTAGLLLGLLRTPPDFDNRDYKGTYYNSSGEAFTKRHRSFRRYLANTSNPTYNNPLWTTKEQSATSVVNRFIVTPEFIITPLDWLQFVLRGGIDNVNDQRVYFFPIASASHTSGTFTEEGIRTQELNFDAIGKGNFNLTSDISLQVMLGWNINDRQRRVNYANLIGFQVNTDKQTTDLNTSADASQIENNKLFRRSNRGYAVLGFDFYNQLNVNLSGAVESASTVNGSYFYPAIDVAWRFTEAFELNPGAISFGKLRVTYGKVGVQPAAHRFQTLAEGGFSYSTYSDPLQIALFGGGFRLDDDRGNPDLEPEIKTEWEIGLDLRFLNDKLSVGGTYYQNEISGILIDLDLTPSSGFDTQYANAATMENKGFEMELDYSIFNSGDWDIGIFGNFSNNRNVVTDLKGTETINLTPGASVSSRALVGHSLGVLYGTASQTNDDGSFDLDANGFPQLTTSPVVLGDPNPDWRSGFGFRGAWKSLSLNVLFEHSQGGAFSPRTLWVLRRFGTTAETANYFTTSTDLVNYDGDVVPAGTTVRGNMENFGGGDVLLDESWYRTGIGGGFGDNQAYNFAIEDATWTRFKELSISYAINWPGFQRTTHLSSIVLTATGRNLILWTDMEGVDPEINQYGVSNGYGLDYFTNPSTRSFLFSIAINF